MSANSSPLTSPPSSDNEMFSFPAGQPTLEGMNSTKEPSDWARWNFVPVVKKDREPSPPHEEVLADNPDIAFIVMFRARFSDAFPSKLVHLGPQDIERGVVDPTPSPHVEGLLCALLGLVMNRKKPVERGHYNRALEDAISAHRSQWPTSWGGANPLSGSRTFNSMAAQERLALLRALVLWSLNSSEAITALIKDSYKQTRHNDDLNQPLSVQPWGKDAKKRRYWLIEGRDDTAFRLYREGNPGTQKATWWSVAGSLPELQELKKNLMEDGSDAGYRLGTRINNAISRFEATEEKRKRREYRMARKAQFARPEPGYSLYEGRTRGKRMKYTFSDDEDEEDQSNSEPVSGIRRSSRNSGAATPFSLGPTVTLSGRQVKSKYASGNYGEIGTGTSASNSARPSPGANGYAASEASEDQQNPNGRETRAAQRATVNGWSKRGAHIEGYNEVDEMEDEEEADFSEDEWDGDDEVDDRQDADEAEDASDASSAEDEDAEPKSLVVTLKYNSSSPAAGETEEKQPAAPSRSASPRKDDADVPPSPMRGLGLSTTTPAKSSPLTAPPIQANASPQTSTTENQPKVTVPEVKPPGPSSSPITTASTPVLTNGRIPNANSTNAAGLHSQQTSQTPQAVHSLKQTKLPFTPTSPPRLMVVMPPRKSLSTSPIKNMEDLSPNQQHPHPPAAKALADSPVSTS